ncbi:hypothetical protein HaLaN_21780, partial [Haematococcus lacustris]
MHHFVVVVQQPGSAAGWAVLGSARCAAADFRGAAAAWDQVVMLQPTRVGGSGEARGLRGLEQQWPAGKDVASL